MMPGLQQGSRRNGRHLKLQLAIEMSSVVSGVAETMPQVPEMVGIATGAARFGGASEGNGKN